MFGESNDNVLVQEFMKGTEYVVDHVSVEGVHKCVAIWSGACVESTSASGTRTATPSSRHHVDGVGRLKFDFYTGGTTRDPATARSSFIIAWNCINQRMACASRN